LHSLSFVDDPTRILRAVRYEQRFHFRVEARTEEHLLDAAPLLERVTAARIRQELDRIFQEARPEETILRLDELGVLKQIHPDLRAGAPFARSSAALRDKLAALPDGVQSGYSDSDHYTEKSQQLAKATTLPRQSRQVVQLEGMDTPIERLYWGLLIYELLPPEPEADGRPTAVEEALSERLKLRGETQRLMRHLQVLKTRLPQLVDPQASPSEIVALLDLTQPHALLLLSLLESDPLLRERLHCYAQTWRHIHPSLNGEDLRRLGLAPGPDYGEILRRLRTALLNGEIAAGDAEWQLAETMIHEKLATA
jgi:tRNA nucleotidyltransferase (CCA-adding enzyme)